MGIQGKSLRALLAVIALSAALAGGAHAAMIKVGDLVLRADGGFTPNTLPRNEFVPIKFQAHADLSRTGGGTPPALQQAILDFDRDGRLTAAGLARCSPEEIDTASPRQARRICSEAIVGKGHVRALVTVPFLGSLPASSALTMFNGPPQAGNPTVVLHAQMTSPAFQTFAVVVPIEQRRHGQFGYRATVNLPPIAGGLGALTHVDMEVGRRFKAKGKERSYVSARCRDGIFDTHGRFTFDDGTVMDGAVQKACNVR
ncbi:MAG TPA: hypothetical protein VF176_05175 [Solirubrobacterales bacterium]